MDTMTSIRQYADLMDGTLTLLLEESPELSNGARVALGRCIDINIFILEEINDYEMRLPKEIKSVTKAKNVLGEPSV